MILTGILLFIGLWAAIQVVNGLAVSREWFNSGYHDGRYYGRRLMTREYFREGTWFVIIAAIIIERAYVKGFVKGLADRA